MITAVDTNILLDVFGADPVFGEASKDALRASLDAGRLVACDLVWAETVAAFPSAGAADDALSTLGVVFVAADQHAAATAGAAWRRYRQAGGRRDRLVAAFLVGAHASAQADRLLTRDRGFFRTYFDELAILDPPSAEARSRHGSR